MTRRVALDNVDHHDLRVALRHGAAFGDNVNRIVVLPTEFAEAQRDFPILFHRDAHEGLQAVALLGLDRDENLFLDGERWTSRHIPLLQQRGPFSFIPAGDDTEPRILVDLDDPRVEAEGAPPLFLPHGGDTRYLDHVRRTLRLIAAGTVEARSMYAAFDALGLIQPIALEVMLDDERHYTVAHHDAIDRDRLAALPGEALARLNRDGFLAPAFLLAASLTNVAQLIERKNARRAAA